MVARFSVLALVAPLLSSLAGVHAYQINTPSKPPVVGQPLTITWTREANDPPTFTIELQNPVFNNDLALATNVDGTLGSFTIPALQPVKQGPNYVIVFVAADDINTQFGSTNSFTILVPNDTTDGTSSTSFASSSTKSTKTTTTSVTTPTFPTTTTGFGATVSNTATNTDLGSTVPGSNTASAAPSASQSSQSLNAAGRVHTSLGGMLAAFLGVVVMAQ